MAFFLPESRIIQVKAPDQDSLPRDGGTAVIESLRLERIEWRIKGASGRRQKWRG